MELEGGFMNFLNGDDFLEMQTLSEHGLANVWWRTDLEGDDASSSTSSELGNIREKYLASHSALFGDDITIEYANVTVLENEVPGLEADILNHESRKWKIGDSSWEDQEMIAESLDLQEASNHEDQMSISDHDISSSNEDQTSIITENLNLDDGDIDSEKAKIIDGGASEKKDDILLPLPPPVKRTHGVAVYNAEYVKQLRIKKTSRQMDRAAAFKESKTGAGDLVIGMNFTTKSLEKLLRLRKACTNVEDRERKRVKKRRTMNQYGDILSVVDKKIKVWRKTDKEEVKKRKNMMTEQSDGELECYVTKDGRGRPKKETPQTPSESKQNIMGCDPQHSKTQLSLKPQSECPPDGDKNSSVEPNVRNLFSDFEKTSLPLPISRKMNANQTLENQQQKQENLSPVISPRSKNENLPPIRRKYVKEMKQNNVSQPDTNSLREKAGSPATTKKGPCMDKVKIEPYDESNIEHQQQKQEEIIKSQSQPLRGRQSTPGHKKTILHNDVTKGQTPPIVIKQERLSSDEDDVMKAKSQLDDVINDVGIPLSDVIWQEQSSKFKGKSNGAVLTPKSSHKRKSQESRSAKKLLLSNSDITGVVDENDVIIQGQSTHFARSDDAVAKDNSGTSGGENVSGDILGKRIRKAPKHDNFVIIPFAKQSRNSPKSNKQIVTKTDIKKGNTKSSPSKTRPTTSQENHGIIHRQTGKRTGGNRRQPKIETSKQKSSSIPSKYQPRTRASRQSSGIVRLQLGKRTGGRPTRLEKAEISTLREVTVTVCKLSDDHLLPSMATPLNGTQSKSKVQATTSGRSETATTSKNELSVTESSENSQHSRNIGTRQESGTQSSKSPDHSRKTPHKTGAELDSMGQGSNDEEQHTNERSLFERLGETLSAQSNFAKEQEIEQPMTSTRAESRECDETFTDENLKESPTPPSDEPYDILPGGKHIKKEPTETIPASSETKFTAKAAENLETVPHGDSSANSPMILSPTPLNSGEKAINDNDNSLGEIVDHTTQVSNENTPSGDYKNSLENERKKTGTRGRNIVQKAAKLTNRYGPKPMSLIEIMNGRILPKVKEEVKIRKSYRKRNKVDYAQFEDPDSENENNNTTDSGARCGNYTEKHEIAVATKCGPQECDKNTIYDRSSDSESVKNTNNCGAKNTVVRRKIKNYNGTDDIAVLAKYGPQDLDERTNREESANEIVTTESETDISVHERHSKRIKCHRNSAKTQPNNSPIASSSDAPGVFCSPSDTLVMIGGKKRPAVLMPTHGGGSARLRAYVL